MRDVASRAGVAVSTVSRAFADPERINAETRDLVLRAAEELGYTAPARMPATKLSNGSLALVLPDITNTFYIDMIGGSQACLRGTGITQILVNTEGLGGSERAAYEALSESALGAVLTASRLSDKELVDLSQSMPLVTFNRRIEGVPDVSIDTSAAFGDAVRHLADLGHRSITYVAGPDVSLLSRRRWEGCLDAAESLDVDLCRIGPFTPWTQAGAAAADVMIESRDTAAIAFNDNLAIGMLQRFFELGVRVPDDVSVIGCDDIVGAVYSSPPLTTISAPTHEVGRRLTQLLLDLIADPEARRGDRIELPVHLEVRGSTGPARS